MIRSDIRSLSAYHVPDSKGLIKLDAMENPYPLPDTLRMAWAEHIAETDINRYPDADMAGLRQRIAEHEGVSPKQVLIGNGSDEIIQMLLLAMATPGRCVLSVEPGFVMYHMIATFTAMDYVGVPLQADFSLDRPALLAAIEEQQPAIVFLAWPNNPTGNLFARADIEAVLAAAPGVVVIDEAYHAFADSSFMPELGKHPNLLVMRTLSKMGLAGLRLGLLAGPPAWLEEFDKVRLPYNINVLTQLTADFALQHQDVFETQTRRIVQDRDWLYTALQDIDGLTVYPSQANFILFRTPPGQAGRIFEALKGAGILIKNLDPAGGLLRDCLRVTVGTAAENAAFIDALQKVVR